MSRPGLAASRSIDIIEFLARSPGVGFTLTEIVRGADINIASCFAVLNRLTERGYLVRTPDEKTYTLGPSLVAVGQAGIKSQSIINRASRAAEGLLRELDVPVLLSTVVGDEILAVISLEDSAGRSPGLQVGARLPLLPPVGSPFLAWASDEAVDAWIATRASRPDPQLVAEWRRDLALTRQRGFQVAMRTGKGPTMADLISEMAGGRSGADYKDEMKRLINAFEHEKAQPESIVEDELYEVVLISSPIFNQNGGSAYNLGLGGFSHKLSGATINSYAESLMRTCVEIMRADRSQPRRHEPFPEAPATARPRRATGK